LLAEVYLAMTRGQNSLSMDLGDGGSADDAAGAFELLPIAAIIVRRASAEELLEHEALLDKLDKDVKGVCLWRA
jgi:DNA polymerase-3 subunit epsilon